MRKGFLAVCLIALSTGAQAAIVDAGWYNTDSRQNLHWMDLTMTAGMSADEALSTYDGWRMATNAEVESLFDEIFFRFEANSNGRSIADHYNGQYGYNGAGQEIGKWMSLFGVLWTDEYGDYEVTFGRYFDENGRYSQIGASWQDGADYAIYSPQWMSSSSDGSLSSYTSGVLLVRSTVPIPAAAWLFGSALAGLSIARRGRSRSTLRCTS